MIQRKQTIWLIICTIAALLSFTFPFVTGKILVKGIPADVAFKAGDDFLILILTGSSLILSAVTIFLYKDRKMQIKLCLVGLLISVVIIILYFNHMNKLSKSTASLACILPFIMAIGYFLAFRDIRKDEKLVKSLDKLR